MSGPFVPFLYVIVEPFCHFYYDMMQGIGRFLYMELIKRLQDVGISTVLCWGDKESEGFWHKQGFVPIAEVDTKGKARRLPIKADIRRSLCFPGGSTLMVSHVNKSHYDSQGSSIKLWLKAPEKPTSSTDEFYRLEGGGEGHGLPISVIRLSAGEENVQLHLNGSPERKLCQNGLALVPHEIMDNGVDGHSVAATAVAEHVSSTYERNMKRTWETSSSSLKSKRIKASQLTDHESYPDSALVLDNKRKDDSPSNQSPLGMETIKSADAVEGSDMKQNAEQCSLKLITDESQATEKQFNIMLMDIADGAKKEYLKNIIWELGGNVTTDGSSCSHVLTVKARRTLNFCTALCSGAWIVSPNWLKESFRKGRFADELPFIVQDEDYLMKFRVDLKEAVLRARENPGKLLKGYTVCLTTHVNLPIETLAAIIWSAGGKVKVGCEDVSDKSQTIFIASEEDMEEALLAVKRGIRTFSTDWFMNCIMKQELELDAPQFAESL